MKLEHAELLEDTLSTIDVEVRDYYSGRGMYGKQTAAIVVDSLDGFLSGVGNFLADVANCDIDEVHAIGEAMKNMKMDSMGLGIVIY